MGEIIIKQNQGKQFGLIIMGIIMVASSIFILIVDSEFFGSILIAKFIGIIGFLFFGACLIFIIKRFINPKNILVIGEKGITDNSSAISIGFIPWEAIDEVFISTVILQKFIAVKINNIEKRLEDMPIAKKKVLKSNIALCGAAICINLNATKYKHKDVLEIIQRYMKFYKTKEE